VSAAAPEPRDTRLFVVTSMTTITARRPAPARKYLRERNRRPARARWYAPARSECRRVTRRCGNQRQILGFLLGREAVDAPESLIALWMVATLRIWLSSTPPAGCRYWTEYNFSKRRAPSCESVKPHSQRPGESDRSRRGAAHVLSGDTGVRLTMYHPPAHFRPFRPVQNFCADGQNAAFRGRAFLRFERTSFFTSTISTGAVVPISSFTRGGSSTPAVPPVSPRPFPGAPCS